MVSGERGPWRDWARGVCLAATGRYDAAFRILSPVASDSSEPAGLAAATVAAIYRQLGGHAQAVGWDERALESRGAAVNDGLLGRAADEIGLGNPDGAAEWLDRAADCDGWRDSVRRSWVRTEWYLLTGRHREAMGEAARALDVAVTAGSVRHVIKSRLFLLVAEDAAARPAGTDSYGRISRDAARLRLRPLVWPAVCAARGHAKAIDDDVFELARSAVRFIDEHLPPDHPTDWTSRADLAALRK